MMDEKNTIQAVLAGDTDRYRELLERYQIGLIIHCRRLMRSDEDGEDCAQQAFIKAYDHLANFDAERGRFSTWLYRIATNVCTDALRKQKRVIPVSDIETLADAWTPDVFKEDAIQDVRTAVQSLMPPSHKQAIIAHYWEGKSYQAIANDMNVSINTVKSWLRRAKQQLKETLV